MCDNYGKMKSIKDDGWIRVNYFIEFDTIIIIIQFCEISLRMNFCIKFFENFKKPLKFNINLSSFKEKIPIK